MIRINLLREPSEKRVRRLRLVRSKWLMIFLAALAVEALLLGGWYYSLLGTEAQQLEETQTLQAEQARLRVLQDQLQEFQRQKVELEGRLRVVERLQANQEGPVKLMNAVTQSMPEDPVLWLTSLTQRGNTLTIEGRAFAVPPIAQFIARLTGRSPIGNVELDFWERTEQWIEFKVTCAVEGR